MASQVTVARYSMWRCGGLNSVKLPSRLHLHLEPSLLPLLPGESSSLHSSRTSLPSFIDIMSGSANSDVDSILHWIRQLDPADPVFKILTLVIKNAVPGTEHLPLQAFTSAGSGNGAASTEELIHERSNSQGQGDVNNADSTAERASTGPGTRVTVDFKELSETNDPFQKIANAIVVMLPCIGQMFRTASIPVYSDASAVHLEHAKYKLQYMVSEIAGLYNELLATDRVQLYFIPSPYMPEWTPSTRAIVKSSELLGSLGTIEVVPLDPHAWARSLEDKVAQTPNTDLEDEDIPGLIQALQQRGYVVSRPIGGHGEQEDIITS
ncbi:uncharacterized protein EI97DRAFT_105957 [Westerdykella ornata]|uniref:Uncharacterized protein n=1 Tax=Westerdykella ornata TaxID=318751 RepID=A0A6A6JVV7_WESOR|nr:uncharacterized protein EI97DRAFT_105957 [Westerdykella ornata]KAF2279948.1 hypothetical protein EI97DRAFT_105957 [Westerdykella ornata]